MYILKISLIFLLHYTKINTQVDGKVTDEEYSLMPQLFYIENFENCMVLRKRALYCTVTVQLAPENPKNKSKVWNIIQNVIDEPRNYRHDQLRHGICVPKSCPSAALDGSNKTKLSEELSSCYSLKYKSLGLKADIAELHCETVESNYPIDNYDIAVATGFGILILIVILGTFYEGLARYKSKEEYDNITNSPVGRIASCFSLPKNWSRLRKGSADGDTFRSINGIRFYNTLLVIVTHVAMISMTSPVINPTFVENLTRNPENMLFLNGSCAIQTFLLISGFLISYNFFLIFEKHKKFQIRYLVLAFINRYIRLTPCLLVMIAFNGTWLYHFSRGAVWDRLVGTEYRNCRTNWWVNLLYVNNYYDVENMCMQHTWYLATDTQLFLFALIVVGFMWKYQSRIKLILGISIAIGIIMPGAVNYYNNYDIVIRQYPEAFYNLFLNVPQWHDIYSSALTNFGGYAFGMVFGYIAYINIKAKTKIFTTKIYVALWWFLVWGLPLGVIYYGIFIYQDDYQYTRLGAAVYVSLQRNLFTLGLCVTLYGTVEGVGWFLRDCVLWPPLQVFGRLTYCTFLVHVAIIRLRGGQATSPTYISNYWIFAQTAGDAVVSYIFATLLALFVELPVSALQKLLVPHLANKDTTPMVKNQNHTSAEMALKEKKK